MSLQARQHLVTHPHIIFANETQKSDLLDIHLTQTELIAHLLVLLNKGHIIGVTAVFSDHHDDLDLNPTSPHQGTHTGGWAVDCWPMNSTTPRDWMDATAPRFRAFLNDAGSSPWNYQVGLAGSADTDENRIAAGSTAFSDSGADHVHLGT